MIWGAVWALTLASLAAKFWLASSKACLHRKLCSTSLPTSQLPNIDPSAASPLRDRLGRAAALPLVMGDV